MNGYHQPSAQGRSRIDDVVLRPSVYPAFQDTSALRIGRVVRMLRGGPVCWRCLSLPTLVRLAASSGRHPPSGNDVVVPTAASSVLPVSHSTSSPSCPAAGQPPRGRHRLPATSALLPVGMSSSRSTASSGFRELGEAFSQHILPSATFAEIAASSATMQSCFDELAVVAQSLLPDFDFDEEQATTTEELPGIPDGRAIALQAAVVLLLVLAVTSAALPGSEELIVQFGRELLEESCFLGQATRRAYVEVSRALPDDNVLGWAAMLAWLLRWLKGASDERTSIE